jgi:hypothetical protein
MGSNRAGVRRRNRLKRAKRQDQRLREKASEGPGASKAAPAVRGEKK